MKPSAKLLILFSGIFLTQEPLITTAAGADCVLECMSHWMCANPGGGHCSDEQSRARDLCEIRCRGKSGTGWGAIAYSTKDRIWGFAIEQDYKATADQVALQYCNRSRGANCVIRVNFFNSCGAIAADSDIVGSGTAGTKESAQQKALAACARLGGKCAIQTSACSGAGAGTSSSAPSAPPAPKAVSWGAIAYSARDSGAGWSQGKDDRASAEKEAMNACSQRGKSCVLQTAFNKQCGALAADRDFTGWGTSTDQRQAQQKAMDACRKAGGTSCVLHILFCSR